MVRSESPQSYGLAEDGIAEALLDLAATVLVKAGKAAWVLACWAVAFPMFSLPLFICLSLDGHYGWPAAVIAALGFACVLVGSGGG